MSDDAEQREPAPAAGAPGDATPTEPPAADEQLTADRPQTLETTATAAPAETTAPTDSAAPPETDVAPTEPGTPVAPAAPSSATPDAPPNYPPPAWSPPAPEPPTGSTPPADTAAPASPFSYPTPADPTMPGGGPPPPPETTKTPGRFRSWLPVAVVAAIIGGGIGAGVTAIADNNSNNNNSGNAVIHESSAAPGAAVLSGNVTIPQLVDRVINSVVSIDVKSNGSEDEGTGMILTSDGEVITNNHVIELYSEGGNKGSITVTEYGQTKPLPATLIGYDQSKDMALLKINGASNLPTVTFGDSSKAVVGDSVVAIGNALGLSAGTPTVTQGIVSALGRTVTAGGIGTQTETLQNMIQTDAAINAGNSGGPLIDTAGQVIGMNTAVAGTSSDGTNSQNIGFAIPTAQVTAALPELQKGGQTGNGGGYLGVDITTLTPALRQQYGFTPTSGAVVLSVVSGSPAAKAGLVQGDVIVTINGTNITSSEDLQKIVQNAKAGQTVSITYYVGNSKRTTSATLGSQAQSQQQPSTGGTGGTTNPFGGGGFPGFGNSGSTGATP
ncbi:MAG TPA: trypsin-like peptidase domain-containing protein [Acidimicrobiales bacterium]|nr:trypsin-like peptidase domain-containing protein [Acidimicrobiales bacterium]